MAQRRRFTRPGTRLGGSELPGPMPDPAQRVCPVVHEVDLRAAYSVKPIWIPIVSNGSQVGVCCDFA